jgi:hypothetical protein
MSSAFLCLMTSLLVPNAWDVLPEIDPPHTAIETKDSRPAPRIVSPDLVNRVVIAPPQESDSPTPAGRTTRLSDRVSAETSEPVPSLRTLDWDEAFAPSSVHQPFFNRAPRIDESKKDLKWPLLVYGVGQALDIVSTAHALRHPGIGEGNPMLNWAGSDAAKVAMCAGFSILGAWAWVRLTGKDHRTLATAGLHALGALHVGLAAHNVAIAQRR